MPDYPATNKAGQLHYGAVQLDIVRLLLWQPTLAQACVVAFCASALFTSFWTTLTFLLSGDPYNYDPLAIGLFALIGIAAIAGGPVYGRLLTDRLVPWYSAVLGMSLAMTGTAVSVGISPLTVAGPIVQALGLDIGLQLVQVSNRTAIFGIDPTARNRINTAYMLLSFCGQLTGTAVGNRLYASGGWRSSAGSGGESNSLDVTIITLPILDILGPISRLTNEFVYSRIRMLGAGYLVGQGTSGKGMGWLGWELESARGPRGGGEGGCWEPGGRLRASC